MYRQLISKFGIMSTEMQEAYIKDQAVIDERGNVDYVDNTDGELVDLTPAEPTEPIEEEAPTLTRQQTLGI